jgi:DNA-binding response OmpR family regulator
MANDIRILYVDDEEELRFLVKTQLTHEGFFIQTADDGDTAIDMLENNSYDIILLDIRMPRVNGIEVLKYIKKQRISARVIMLTAVDDLSVAIEAVKNGAIDYLTKPYDFDTLLKSILRVAVK